MSTVLEDIKPETVAKIAAQAKRRGLSIDEYLRSLLPDELDQAAAAKLSPAEKVRALREWAASHSLNTPLLSDEAISRESIYGERG